MITSCFKLSIHLAISSYVAIEIVYHVKNLGRKFHEWLSSMPHEVLGTSQETSSQLGNFKMTIELFMKSWHQTPIEFT